ncbi:hypothetical protein [Devosia sp.]|uniref:hypothetical protein n=1 Tax=Devosia sp. TaxID=1871048 RepID=UPI001ACD5570|nr:hypothetical protein [Devosia sp.]MBN9310921.1 hypothetical protein [Devosia sp.]
MTIPVQPHLVKNASPIFNISGRKENGQIEVILRRCKRQIQFYIPSPSIAPSVAATPKTRLEDILYQQQRRATGSGQYWS